MAGDVTCMSTKRKRKAKQKRARRASFPERPSFPREVLARAAEMASRGERLPLKDDVAFKMFLS